MNCCARTRERQVSSKGLETGRVGGMAGDQEAASVLRHEEFRVVRGNDGGGSSARWLLITDPR